MIRAKMQDTVKVLYTGTIADGTVFDESPEDRPLHFIVGKQEVVPGFEEAVEGMYRGETKTVTIPYEKAYGASKPELLEKVDRKLLAKDVELHLGGQLQITNDDGSVLCVMVREITDDTVTLDANHPLADKDLTFEIKLLDVQDTPDHPQLPPMPPSN
jgi:peptidylprolyl isomerase